MTRAAPVAVLAAVVAGILLGEARGPAPATTLLLTGGALLLAGLRTRGRVGLLFALVGFLLLGTAVMQRALHGLAVSPLAPAVAHRAHVDAQATLVDDPSGPRFSVRALARVTRIDGNDAGNRTVLGQVRTFKDNNGAYIYVPVISANGIIDQVLGHPWEEFSDMPNIAADSFSIALGDWTRGYVIIDRQGIKMLRDPYTTKGIVKFYTTKRVGGAVRDSDAIKLLKFGTS